MIAEIVKVVSRSIEYVTQDVSYNYIILVTFAISSCDPRNQNTKLDGRAAFYRY